MEIILIIIVVAVISIASAVGKKKPNPSSEENPQRPTMSDIQKAFMLANDFDVRQRSAEQAAPRTEPRDSAMRQNPQPAETSYSSAPATNQYANVNISQYYMDETQDEYNKPPISKRNNGTLKLFEEKDAFVRAVIYSEILTRKGGKHHS